MAISHHFSPTITKLYNFNFYNHDAEHSYNSGYQDGYCKEKDIKGNDGEYYGQEDNDDYYANNNDDDQDYYLDNNLDDNDQDYYLNDNDQDSYLDDYYSSDQESNT